MVEQKIRHTQTRVSPIAQDQRQARRLSEVEDEEELRFRTGIGELDRVLGGGAVAGSLVLVGGTPGIGKSTLLLQLCGNICDTYDVLYVTGEESDRQLKLRAQRLGVRGEMFVLAQTDMDSVIRTAEAVRPGVLIIDSIQTQILIDALPAV